MKKSNKGGEGFKIKFELPKEYSKEAADINAKSPIVKKFVETWITNLKYKNGKFLYNNKEE